MASRFAISSCTFDDSKFDGTDSVTTWLVFVLNRNMREAFTGSEKQARCHNGCRLPFVLHPSAVEAITTAVEVARCTPVVSAHATSLTNAKWLSDRNVKTARRVYSTSFEGIFLAQLQRYFPHSSQASDQRNRCDSRDEVMAEAEHSRSSTLVIV